MKNIAMKIIYAHEPLHSNKYDDLNNRIFLAGPTPRSSEVKSWRPTFIKALRKHKFNGTVLIPEASDGVWKNDYIKQVEWELEAIHSSNLVVFWVPRSLPDMPAFTTNVEFGFCIAKTEECGADFDVMYGRPKNAEKISYLDHINKKYNLIYPKPFNNINSMAKKIVENFE